MPLLAAIASFSAATMDEPMGVLALIFRLSDLEATQLLLTSIIPPGALTTLADTRIVPALVANLGEQASWRYVEFFPANINNDHTRRACARACARQADAWRMIRRRAVAAGIMAPIGNHTFRATGSRPISATAARKNGCMKARARPSCMIAEGPAHAGRSRDQTMKTTVVRCFAPP